jgi:Arc-like DNA binding domain
MARRATKSARKRTDTVHLNLRLSEGLRRRLAREAWNRGWSLNMEINARLEESLLGIELAPSPAIARARALRSFLDDAVLDELVTLFLKEEAEQGDPQLAVDRLEAMRLLLEKRKEQSK